MTDVNLNVNANVDGFIERRSFTFASTFAFTVVRAHR